MAEDEEDEQVEVFDAAEEQRLKAAVHFAIGEMVSQREEEEGIGFSKQFIAALTELTFRQFATVAQDLEAFAKHGKRSTVGVDDVKLLARRKAEVTRMIEELADSLTAAEAAQRASKKAKKGGQKESE